jgi:Arc/MetJ-type ribon-helix-helix transcriptional regulator
VYCGEEVKDRTDNVSAYVTDALTEKLERERRRAARERIWEAAQESDESPAQDLYAINQRERRAGDRDFPVVE